MTRRRKIVLWLASMALIPVGLLTVFVINLIWFRPFNIDFFYERVFIETALAEPELLSSLRIVEPYGIYFHNDDLTPVSDTHKRRQLEKAERDLATLRSYSRERQSESQRLSTDILAWYLDQQARGKSFLHHDYPVNQFDGVQSELLNFMTTLHVVSNEQEAGDYIARLNKFDWKLDQLTEAVETRAGKGIIPPRFVLERVLGDLRGVVQGPATEHVLYTAFEKKLRANVELSEAETARYLENAANAIESTVVPAYAKLIAVLEDLAKRATGEAGVWKLPDGGAYYAHCLREHTTTDMSAEAIHTLGRQEVERITTDMRAILDELGHTGRTVGEWMAELANDDQFHYPETEAGREQCLADYQRIIDAVSPKLDAVFKTRPEAPVKVKRVPPFREASAAGAYYYPPAMDGSRPGIFYANLRDMSEISKWDMETLVYHEALPGHHFQIALQQELPGLPTFRNVLPFTAYAEGWALYAERLARERGYFSSPYDELGQLQAELFRSVRLVSRLTLMYKE